MPGWSVRSTRNSLEVFSRTMARKNAPFIQQKMQRGGIVCEPFRLDVWRICPPSIRTFVPIQAQPTQVFLSGLREPRNDPVGVDILESPHEFPSLASNGQPGNKGRASIAYMDEPCRRWRIATSGPILALHWCKIIKDFHPGTVAIGRFYKGKLALQKAPIG